VPSPVSQPVKPKSPQATTAKTPDKLQPKLHTFELARKSNSPNFNVTSSSPEKELPLKRSRCLAQKKIVQSRKSKTPHSDFPLKHKDKHQILKQKGKSKRCNQTNEQNSTEFSSGFDLNQPSSILSRENSPTDHTLQSKEIISSETADSPQLDPTLASPTTNNQQVSEIDRNMSPHITSTTNIYDVEDPIDSEMQECTETDNIYNVQDNDIETVSSTTFTTTWQESDYTYPEKNVVRRYNLRRRCKPLRRQTMISLIPDVDEIRNLAKTGICATGIKV
jgi:hypothetical protein